MQRLLDRIHRRGALFKAPRPSAVAACIAIGMGKSPNYGKTGAQSAWIMPSPSKFIPSPGGVRRDHRPLLLITANCMTVATWYNIGYVMRGRCGDRIDRKRVRS